MSKTKRYTPITIEVGLPRKGHYEFHNGKCHFDNRPKRQRTRSNAVSTAIKEQF